MCQLCNGEIRNESAGQSLAREFGPKGVHVAHAIIDGVIDIPRTKEWKIEGEDGKISADAVSLFPSSCPDLLSAPPGGDGTRENSEH